MEPKKNDDDIKSSVKSLNISLDGITGLRQFLYNRSYPLSAIYLQKIWITELLLKQYKCTKSESDDFNDDSNDESTKEQKKSSVGIQTEPLEPIKVEMRTIGTQYSINDFDDWIVVNDDNN